jgi:hypothetical protein
MDPITALHTAARRYCFDRAALWHQRYVELVASRGAEANRSCDHWSYTADDYDTFPRYQVLAAIQSEVECFLPADFTSLDKARHLLELAGSTARNHFTNHNDPVAIAAVEDERHRFAVFIRELDEAQLSVQRKLPFRRTLGSEEHMQLHHAFTQSWGTWYGGSVDRNPSQSPVVTLHVAAMKEPESYDALRAVLIERGIPRLFELREHGTGFEIETNIAAFTYNGAEGFWTSADFGWMVYASHESSISFGSSWLVEHMRSLIPEFAKYVYKGWDVAAYN